MSYLLTIGVIITALGVHASFDDDKAIKVGGYVGIFIGGTMMALFAQAALK